jgi:hypothetical protein
MELDRITRLFAPGAGCVLFARNGLILAFGDDEFVVE